MTPTRIARTVTWPPVTQTFTKPKNTFTKPKKYGPALTNPEIELPPYFTLRVFDDAVQLVRWVSGGWANNAYRLVADVLYEWPEKGWRYQHFKRLYEATPEELELLAAGLEAAAAEYWPDLYKETIWQGRRST